jgi:hypothetical protein
VGIHEGSNLAGKIGEGMLAVELLIADGLASDWKAVLMISKTILAKAMPPGRAPDFHSFRRFRRRIRYSEIAHNGCAESI